MIEKNVGSLNRVTIKGDNRGNLVPYRISSVFRDVINEKIQNGQLTLRGPFGLFDTVEPILTDARAKHKYLIEAQLQQGGNVTGIFRFEIASSTVQDSNKGKHITLQLTSPTIRLSETFDSARLSLKTPHEAFNERMIKFRSNTFQSMAIRLLSNWNGLPDTDSLKQNWYVPEPTSTLDLLSEIIRKVSQPQTVASTNEDYYFKVLPVLDSPRNYDMIVRKLGSSTRNVKVSVKPAGDNVTIYDSSKDTDNKKYKNSIIMKGPRGAHKYPMSYTRHASDIVHTEFGVVSVWQNNTTYYEGDYVVDTNNNGYKCIREHTSTLFNRYRSNRDTTYWKALNINTDWTPFTNDHTLWLDNLDGQDNKAGFKGYFHDWNIARRLYNPDNFNNPFISMAIKDVEGIRSSPPSNPEHGERWLIRTGTGVWAGRSNRIAQYHIDHWEFSGPPENDKVLINVNNTATVIRWDGSKFVTVWDLTQTDNAISPYCPVRNLFIEKGQTMVSNTAIKTVFDWNFLTVENLIDELNKLIFSLGSVGIASVSVLGYALKDAPKVLTGEQTVSEYLIEQGETFQTIRTALGHASTLDDGVIGNLYGRRYGWSMGYPFGDLIKTKSADYYNLTKTMNGKTDDWNSGQDSEDLGTFRSFTFWVRVRFENHRNDIIHGLANMKQIFWFRDIADRIAIHRYTIPAHNVWQKITIPCGPDSGLDLFDSRVDELWRLLGISFSNNFFINERELTGARFDWSQVIDMGTMSADSYDENLMYVAHQSAWWDAFEERTIQTARRLAAYITGTLVIDVENHVIDHVNYEFEGIGFDKDVYVITSDSVSGELRQEMIRYTEDWDYVNMRNIVGKRMVSRRQFHPHVQNIYCDGNVSLRAGDSFEVEGAHDSVASVVALEVDHLEDQSGYHCMIKAVRRYEVDS